MKIGYLCFTSFIHNEESIRQQSDSFITALKDLSGHDFVEINESEWGKQDLSVVFIRSGGTENMFKEFYLKLPRKDKIIILTYGYHNSLAAAMEILSYINQNGCEGEILHGSNVYIVERLNKLGHPKQGIEALKGSRLGVIGKPSDWLIASDVNYNIVKDSLGIQLIDISMAEFSELIALTKVDKSAPEYQELEKKNDRGLDILPTIRIYRALKQIVDKYRLDGLTIRCFDLLSSFTSTGCVGLAYLNSLGISGACEGDVPTLITMYFANKVLKELGFQANPSFIDVEKKEIIFAHCTLPFKMVSEYSLNTHFESGLGVGIKGEFEKQAVTIFKIGNDLSSYYVDKAELVENLNEPNLCRTQIRLRMNGDVSYFLNHSLGNHHLIILGDHVSEIDRILSSKMRRVK